ncbi:hypothetical protein EG329_006819 [Mollisiaceae sp. DMI_Dod_QoI]|nr:hypothetical protein EG329_006819 [Helotiales sp. DMI_Dod_QoI]
MASPLYPGHPRGELFRHRGICLPPISTDLPQASPEGREVFGAVPQPAARYHNTTLNASHLIHMNTSDTNAMGYHREQNSKNTDQQIQLSYPCSSGPGLSQRDKTRIREGEHNVVKTVGRDQNESQSSPYGNAHRTPPRLRQSPPLEIKILPRGYNSSRKQKADTLNYSDGANSCDNRIQQPAPQQLESTTRSPHPIMEPSTSKNQLEEEDEDEELDALSLLFREVALRVTPSEKISNKSVGLGIQFPETDEAKLERHKAYFADRPLMRCLDEKYFVPGEFIQKLDQRGTDAEMADLLWERLRDDCQNRASQVRPRWQIIEFWDNIRRELKDDDFEYIDWPPQEEEKVVPRSEDQYTPKVKA